MGENKNISLLTDFDIDLFKAGKHYRIYEKLGAHEVEVEGVKGIYFAVWAPNASFVSVIGNFNGWNTQSNPLHVRWDGSGIWEEFVPGIYVNEVYKYHIESQNGYIVDKADPYATFCESAPRTASVVQSIDGFKWRDANWMDSRGKVNIHNKPLSIYEVHLGSWRRTDDNEKLTYRQLADELPGYCKFMGFTHVELMPVMEHPFYGSWGYQITGYFAPSSRYGTPMDFMHLIDALHAEGIGVILDWVPSHFPTDEHGLGYFDGTHLYEHENPQKGFHPDWKSFVFNYGRNEVRTFLISNALFWLDKYHIDGLRVDAVASMLYLDYSREAGEWTPNEYGGRENLEAVHFIREFNDAVHTHYLGVFTIAEESTAWPGVTKPVQSGGLGFDMKWMMGWMHDTLQYFSRDPFYRTYHQGQITFSLVYAFSEQFVLPLSHDEVVHGKYSLLNKMPGDEWQKFANLRLLYTYMFTHPGAKLIFMGGEFAQSHEWRHDYSLDWHENNNVLNNGIQHIVRKLNALYQDEVALHVFNYSWEGFQWIDTNDTTNSVLVWMRKGAQAKDTIIIVANFTPVPRHNYRIGIPEKGVYYELFNSDNKIFGGSGLTNADKTTYPIARHSYKQSLSITLPPLGIVMLKKKG